MASKCRFQGPAQSEFANFEDQALSTLNSCCPRWNDNEDPRSYMIPPIFYFNHPEKPDHELEVIKLTGEFDRTLIDRASDDAEHKIFAALNTLINERFAAPFVVLHGFNVNRIGASLGHIFPGLPSSWIKQPFCEYDYILLGPIIGIVVIEVKSTAFTQIRDFNLNSPEQHQRLPERYLHGIKQLRSFDCVLDLLELLRVTATSCMHREHVRRILFTPNLKKARYDEWFNSLDESRRNIVNESIEGIDRWFWEDAQPASHLCAKLRSYLADCQATHRLPCSLFEIYVPILTGLSSVSISKASIDIDSETLSMEEALLRVSDCIESQNPCSLEPVNKRRAKRPNQPIDLLNVIILTPEQSATLRGPARQFIVGAAGTGKTIILQAKALEELRKGESVLVLCWDLCICQYVDLFERHHLKGFSVKSWPQIRDRLPKDADLENCQSMEKSRARLVGATRTFVYECLEDTKKRIWLTREYFKDLIDYDHVLIDDAFAREYSMGVRSGTSSVRHALRMMAYAEMHTCRWKTVWVALDPFSDETYYYSLDPFKRLSALHHLRNDSNNQIVSRYFDISYLHRVMRNPENIFHPLLPMCNNIAPDQEPKIGHKIQGVRIFKIATSCDSLSKEIHDLLVSIKGKYLLDQIAVIVGETSSAWTRMELVKFLEKRNVSCACYVNKDSRMFVPAHECNSHGGKLMVFKWDQVHSMEWPLVIFIEEGIRSPDESPHRECHDGIFRYRKYLACSRATAMLVEISLDEFSLNV